MSLLLLLIISVHFFPVADPIIEIPVTISASLLDGSTDWTDYPLYIPLSSLGTSFWDYNKGSGDIHAYDDAYPAGTELPSDVIYRDAGSEEGTLFILIDLDADADMTIYIRTGYADATAYSPDTDVWAALYRGWSLVEGTGAGSGGIKDLTGNEDGTPSGVLYDVTGKLEKPTIGANQGSSSGYISLGTAVTYESSSTMMCWVNLDSLSAVVTGNNQQLMRKQYTSTDGDIGKYRFDINENGSGTERMRMVANNGSYDPAETVNNAWVSGDLNTWRHATWVVNGTSVSMYKDASSLTMADATTSVPSGTNNSAVRMLVGVNGDIDMVLWFSSVLSADQITAAYRNQGSPGSYLTTGSTNWISTRPQVIMN